MAFRVDARAALFVFGLPLLFLRIALMVGNWGQHAFVDCDEPDSDYRSSVTLVDVAVSHEFFLGFSDLGSGVRVGGKGKCWNGG